MLASHFSATPPQEITDNIESPHNVGDDAGYTCTGTYAARWKEQEISKWSVDLMPLWCMTIASDFVQGAGLVANDIKSAMRQSLHVSIAACAAWSAADSASD